jgi:hypothetical protein
LEADHATISLRRQCDLLGLPRSTAYYAPIAESAENLALMRQIDAVYLENPSYGSRSIATVLSNGGWRVNRKRVQRLMRRMGIAGVTPKRNASKPSPGHRIFAYLLRNVVITHPDQVWSTDITYVPLRGGFVYLTAVMDWYSRYKPRLARPMNGVHLTLHYSDATCAGREKIGGSEFQVERLTMFRDSHGTFALSLHCVFAGYVHFLVGAAQHRPKGHERKNCKTSDHQCACHIWTP